MNARSAVVVLEAEAAKRTGEVRGALEIALGVMRNHLARRDRVEAKRKARKEAGK